MIDTLNNIGRHCDVLGVSAPSRSWVIESQRPDPNGTSYWLRNTETGARMISSFRALVNLW